MTECRDHTAALACQASAAVDLSQLCMRAGYHTLNCLIFGRGGGAECQCSVPFVSLEI